MQSAAKEKAGRAGRERIRGLGRLAGYWLPPLIWVGSVTWLSRGTLSDQAPGWLFSQDKLLHVVYFGGLALMLMRAFYGGCGWSLPAAAVCAFLLAASYGAWDEYRQGFNPYRTRDLADWQADVVGAGTVFVAWFIYRVRQRNRAPGGRASGRCDP